MFLENFIITQLVKKFPTLRNPNIHYCAPIGPYPEPV